MTADREAFRVGLLCFPPRCFLSQAPADVDAGFLILRGQPSASGAAFLIHLREAFLNGGGGGPTSSFGNPVNIVPCRKRHTDRWTQSLTCEFGAPVRNPSPGGQLPPGFRVWALISETLAFPLPKSSLPCFMSDGGDGNVYGSLSSECTRPSHAAHGS